MFDDLEGRVYRVLSDLVAIPSVNPAFVERGMDESDAGEGAVADYIESYLQDIGLEVERQEVFAGRDNIVGLLEGRKRGPGYVWESHMDTVQTTGMQVPPFQASLVDGCVYGRGAVDAKGCLTAMMEGLRLALDDRLRPTRDIFFVAAVDEEYRFEGVKHLVAQGFRAVGGVVGEPTQLRLVTACKGVVRARIGVRGRAAHSSAPGLGVNAVEYAADLITYLRDVLIPRLERRAHRLVGAPTLTHTMIAGGIGPNTIPDSCLITFDRRLVPGETAHGAMDEVRAVLDEYRATRPNVEIFLEDPFIIDDAMEVEAAASIVRCATRAAVGLLADANVHGVSFGCDASKLTAAGVPTLVFGPGTIELAHAANEHVALRDVVKAARFFSRLAFAFNEEE